MNIAGTWSAYGRAPSMPSRPIQPLCPFCPLHRPVYFCILIFWFFWIGVFCKFVFSYFCILFLSRCIQPLCPFFTAHYLPGLYHHSFVMPSYIVGFNFSPHVSLWCNIEIMTGGGWNIPYSYFHTLLCTVILLSDAILRNDWRLDKYRQVGRRKWVLIEGQVANLRDRRTGIGL